MTIAQANTAPDMEDLRDPKYKNYLMFNPLAVMVRLSRPKK